MCLLAGTQLLGCYRLFQKTDYYPRSGKATELYGEFRQCEAETESIRNGTERKNFYNQTANQEHQAWLDKSFKLSTHKVSHHKETRITLYIYMYTHTHMLIHMGTYMCIYTCIYAGLSGKESTCNAEDYAGSIPGSRRSPGGGHGNSLQYSCLENFHGQMSLRSYSPWGQKELDITEETEHACIGKLMM